MSTCPLRIVKPLQHSLRHSRQQKCVFPGLLDHVYIYVFTMYVFCKQDSDKLINLANKKVIMLGIPFINQFLSLILVSAIYICYCQDTITNDRHSIYDIIIEDDKIINLTDELFNSFNIDLSRQRQFFDINWKESKLKYLASQLGPAYLVSYIIYILYILV